ncbi:MAG TPA: hypothetical protein VMH05_15550 [Bryobacteraceae bacterium]|nr:hypothetical protein [Bryobacteraceae bacterium]
MIDHLNPPYERLGPCVHRCGETARYVQVDDDRESYRVECPACGTYPAQASDVEDACDPEV